MARVGIYESDYEHIERAVERAFEAHGPPVAGRSVLLKPNILGAAPPERHVNTHPSLVRAAIRALRRRGTARIMVGDNSGMMAYGSNEDAARTAGILAVAGDYYVNLGADPVRVPVRSLLRPDPYGSLLRPDPYGSAFAAELAFSRQVLEADVLVSLPKMKTHVATGITGAVKNSFGHLVGAEKTRLHREARGPENFAQAVVDVFQVRRPDLVILDAVVAMEGQGPSGGRPRQVGRVLASSSAVALDTVMATMMGLEPRRVPMLRIAEGRGLGPADLAAIAVEGPLEVVPRFSCPPIGMGLGALVSRIGATFLPPWPKTRYERCVKCGSCVQACPVEAIAMADRGPVIDYGRCIRCFCCHEMCRYEAMDLGRRLRFGRRGR